MVVGGIGVPVKLLHEAQGLLVTVELINGTIYRGRLSSIEDNMNVQLRDVTSTAKDGQVSALDHVMVRGSQVKFFVVPDNLKYAAPLKDFGKEKVVRGLGASSKGSSASNLQRMPYK